MIDRVIGQGKGRTDKEDRGVGPSSGSPAERAIPKFSK
jgi:hypothetical protein